MSPYVPHALPLAGLDLARLIRKIGPANAALARYDGLLQSVVNPGVMLSPLTNREAVLSSKIEGTQATVDEVLEYEAGMEFEGAKEQDIREIVNYRKALTLATDVLADRPLSLALIRSMHAVLMDSVRGEGKSPGQFRVNQNWLGSEGCEIDQATFVPPSPLQLLDHLEAFEHYLATDDVDPLVQVAVVHAQFELIHPFKDGNGRIGRLLIPPIPLPQADFGQPDVLPQRVPRIAPRLVLRPPPTDQPGRRLDLLGRILPGCNHRPSAVERREGPRDSRPLRPDEGPGHGIDPVSIRPQNPRRPVRSPDLPGQRLCNTLGNSSTIGVSIPCDLAESRYPPHLAASQRATTGHPCLPRSAQLCRGAGRPLNDLVSYRLMTRSFVTHQLSFLTDKVKLCSPVIARRTHA